MENMENEKPGQLPILEKTPKKRHTGRLKTVGPMNLGKFTKLSEVQQPDTVRAALSGIPKKNVGAKGVGGCENAWTFGGWYMDENSQFETWPFNGKWLFFWHFFNSRFDQHAFAPQDCRASAWCKALRFLWREMLDLFFSLAKLIVFNESVSPPMYTKWV